MSPGAVESKTAVQTKARNAVWRDNERVELCRNAELDSCATGIGFGRGKTVLAGAWARLDGKVTRPQCRISDLWAEDT